MGPLKPLLEFIWNHPANKGRRLRSILRAARFQAVCRLTRRPIRARLGVDSIVLAYPGVAASSKVVYARIPDWAPMKAWTRLLSPGDLFVDIGANVGVYTLWALEQGCEVIAVEPIPQSAERLRRNLEANQKQATIIMKAVSDRAGFVKMTHDLDSMNHLAPEGRSVEATTLDDILLARTCWVKIDIEGAELFALRGAKRALSERRIHGLQIEWGINRLQVSELLAQCGYVLYEPLHDGSLRRCRADSASADLFALPGDNARSGES